MITGLPVTSNEMKTLLHSFKACADHKGSFSATLDTNTANVFLKAISNHVPEKVYASIIDRTYCCELFVTFDESEVVGKDGELFVVSDNQIHSFEEIQDYSSQSHHLYYAPMNYFNQCIDNKSSAIIHLKDDEQAYEVLKYLSLHAVLNETWFATIYTEKQQSGHEYSLLYITANESDIVGRKGDLFALSDRHTIYLGSAQDYNESILNDMNGIETCITVASHYFGLPYDKVKQILHSMIDDENNVFQTYAELIHLLNFKVLPSILLKSDIPIFLQTVRRVIKSGKLEIFRKNRMCYIREKKSYLKKIMHD